MQKQAGENQKAASLEAELKTDSLKGVGGRGTMHLGKERGLEVLERRLAKLKNNKGKARASLLGRKGTPLVVSAGAGGSRRALPLGHVSQNLGDIQVWVPRDGGTTLMATNPHGPSLKES